MSRILSRRNLEIPGWTGPCCGLRRESQTAVRVPVERHLSRLTPGPASTRRVTTTLSANRPSPSLTPLLLQISTPRIRSIHHPVECQRPTHQRPAVIPVRPTDPYAYGLSCRRVSSDTI